MGHVNKHQALYFIRQPGTASHRELAVLNMILQKLTPLYIALAVCGSMALLSSNAFSQQSSNTPRSPSFDKVQITLSESACGIPGSTWRQTNGPTISDPWNSGSTTDVLISEPGDYRFSLACCSIDRIGSLLNSPDRIGFGAATTGGAAAGGFEVVTSVADSGRGSLREALLKPGPLWITFDPSIHNRTITVNSNINVTDGDITIDGRGANMTLKAGSNANKLVMLTLRGGNTIIAGITVDGNNSDGTGVMPREGYNYWLDHLTITNFGSDDALSIGQGSRPDTSASEVTVSNYRVFNTSKGLKAGGNDKYPNYPRHRITIHKSYLGAKDRNPRIQYGGQTHVFNSYINSYVYGGMDAGRGAQIISENNVFLSTKANGNENAQMGRPAGTGPTGYVYSSNDLFLGGAYSSGEINPNSPNKFDIPYAYQNSLIPVESVKDFVENNAGAQHSGAAFNSCDTYQKRLVVSAE